MKVEYVNSSFGIDLVIPISEFKKAEKSKREMDILNFILYSFACAQGTKIVYNYFDIIKLLPKSGNVVFVIKESTTRRFNPPRWCEIHSISDNVSKPILFSIDDGNNLYLNTEE